MHNGAIRSYLTKRSHISSPNCSLLTEGKFILSASLTVRVSALRRTADEVISLRPFISNPQDDDWVFFFSAILSFSPKCRTPARECFSLVRRLVISSQRTAVLVVWRLTHPRRVRLASKQYFMTEGFTFLTPRRKCLGRFSTSWPITKPTQTQCAWLV